jgi:hypothetical protein
MLRRRLQYKKISARAIRWQSFSDHLISDLDRLQVAKVMAIHPLYKITGVCPSEAFLNSAAH